MTVYINDIAAFLPHSPVSNDEIEAVLGRVNGFPSKARRIVLKNNGIRTRHYAIDPETGRLTHTNAQLAAEAVRGLRPDADFRLDKIQTLCCGTSTPDLLLPGHGLMVQGELGLDRCEAVTTAGICISGMTAFKYAWMNIAVGCSSNAVAIGSELASSFFRARHFTPFLQDVPDERHPIRAFDADFLRWMLSDGAGAAFLSDRKNPDRISLAVEWIENISFAGRHETCMYAGGCKTCDGRMLGWRQSEDIEEMEGEERQHLMAVRQDIRLLDKTIVATMGEALSQVVGKHDLAPDGVDWFLPHYSSAYFRPRFYEQMKEIGFEIPEERWFTNLQEKGNTGSAAIYIILAELFSSGRIEPGQQLLCFIPESGRFSHCFMMLRAV